MKMKKTVRMPLRRAPQPRTRPPAASLRARTATAEEYDEEEEDYGGEEEPNMKFSHALLVVLVLHILAVGGIFAFNSLKAKQSAEIKQAATPAATEKAAPAPEAQAPAEKAAARPLTQPAAATGKTHTVAAGETLTKIASIHGITIEALEKENGITTYSMIRVGQVLKLPEDAKPAGKTTAKSEPAKSAATKDAFMATKTDAPAKPAQGAIVSTPKAPAAETKPAAPVEKAPAEALADDGVYVVVKGDNPYSIAKKLHVSYNDLLSVNDIKDPTKIQIGQKLKVPSKN